MELIPASVVRSRRDDMSSYLNIVDLPAESLQARQSSHAALMSHGAMSTHAAAVPSHGAMIDVTPSGVSAGTTDLIYPPLDSSPSIISLLNDKLDSQTKATISHSLPVFPIYVTKLVVIIIITNDA